jgi:23S rRNA (guanine745-N1)-methyltransferase
VLAEVVAALVCPVCRADLVAEPATLRCPTGHSFDVARQGYVNLLAALGRPPLNADDASAVAARVDFLTAGHFVPVVGELAAMAAACWPAGLIVDAGSGPGHYLGAALDAVPGAVGLALDSSVAALRRAARVHQRAAAIGWDVTERWPVRDGAAGVVLNVFAPRNAAEYARVLRRDGRLLVVVPGPGHLGELVDRLGLIGVDAAKPARLAATLDPFFELVGEKAVGYHVDLTRDQVRAAVAMGPNAWHLSADVLAERVAGLPELTRVGVDAVLKCYRPR